MSFFRESLRAENILILLQLFKELIFQIYTPVEKLDLNKYHCSRSGNVEEVKNQY